MDPEYIYIYIYISVSISISISIHIYIYLFIYASIYEGPSTRDPSIVRNPHLIGTVGQWLVLARLAKLPIETLERLVVLRYEPGS